MKEAKAKSKRSEQKETMIDNSIKVMMMMMMIITCGHTSDAEQLVLLGPVGNVQEVGHEGLSYHDDHHSGW